MTKHRLLLTLSIPLVISSCLTGCDKKEKRIEDNRELTAFERTQLSYSAIDALGREIPVVDLCKDGNTVGIFYHVWHGYHNDNRGIYDVTKLLHDNPEALFNLDVNEPASPLGQYHYWGEPLYGYYSSDDPWVVARHMELLTTAGVDYICMDLSNAFVYTKTINVIFQTLDKFQKQGFKVPKVTFLTNSQSGKVMKTFYENWYKKGLYSSLWYTHGDDPRPMMIGDVDDLKKNFPKYYDEIVQFCNIRATQWPQFPVNKENGFPWMDWKYEQTIYNDGTISVSLAQHPGCNCANGPETNMGRGFDYDIYENSTDRVAEGSNFEDEYRTVFKHEDKVRNVFITGFNEWIAIKQRDSTNPNGILMVDTYNEEYSRDVEMFRGYKDQPGYGDNYFLQMMRLNRKFLNFDANHYLYNENSINIDDFSETQWETVKDVYMDFAGDAMDRYYVASDKTSIYEDHSNRNDIVKTSVTHDATNVYFRVECLEDITEKELDDKTWMNILINSNVEGLSNWNGYNYIINRDVSNGKASIEALDAEFNATKIGEADIKVSGKVMQVAVPLALINKTEEDAHISFKVADHITDQSDIMEYYISGDSAPIGRVNYTYGY